MGDNYIWQAACRRAITESDVTKVHRRVIDAEEAIFLRQIEIAALRHTEGSDAELKALKSATNDLLAVKTDRLGWPHVA